MAKREHKGPSGLLLLDKPAGMTSHDLVSRVRRLAQSPKVGHAGTLDPDATGLLILGVGKATRLLTWLLGQPKTYTATIRLGMATNTDDAAGQPLSWADPVRLAALSQEQIEQQVAALTGDIMQVPSSVSAIKVAGVRSYARVRQGQEVKLAARPVRVSEFRVSAYREVIDPAEPRLLELDARISCSSGTYVRALARDLGQALHVGAHLSSLRRIKIGQRLVTDAWSLDELAEQEQLPLQPLEEAAKELFASRQLSARQATDLSFGRPIPAEEGPGQPGPVAGFAPNGSLVALLERKNRSGQLLYAPSLVFEAGQTFEELGC